MPLKILFADDSLTAQNMGKKILTDAGYEVIAVSNGAAAMKKLAEKPEIIILDVNMPGYTGLEVCEKVRSNPEMEKTPVLLAVGKMEHFDPKDGQRVRADGVMIKPFEASDLLAAVGKLAERVKAAQKPVYDKTVKMRAVDVQQFEKDESYTGWKSEAPPEEAAEAAEPAELQMSQEMAAAPAMAEFYTEAPAESASTPAYEKTVVMPSPAMTPAAFIEDQMVELPPIPIEAMPAAAPAMVGDDTEEIAPPPGIAGFDDAPVAEAVPEGLTPIEDASLKALLHTEASASPEVEPTSAPSSGVLVRPDPALETNAGGDSEYAIPAQDPALVTDAQEMTNEFPTKFGVENAEPQAVGYVGDLPEEQAAALRSPASEEAAPVESAPPVDDDFEARVAAAMAGFELEGPVAEPEAATIEETSASDPELASGEAIAASMDELPVDSVDPLLETSGNYSIPTPSQEAPTQTEASLEAPPEPGLEPAAEPGLDTAAAAAAPAEAEIEAEPAAVVSTSEVSSEPEMAMAAAASATSVEVEQPPAPIIPEPVDPRSVPEGMVDAELVEQLQAAVAVMPPAPISHEEPPRVSVQEPKPASMNIVDPEIASTGAVDTQLATALAKAVGVEAPQIAGQLSAAALDPGLVSTAVSTVLHRMLPEIVVEVIREVEEARRR